MRRITIEIDEEGDAARGAERSKKDSVRDCMVPRSRPLAPVHDDPISPLVGAYDVSPSEIDRVLYDRE